MAIKDPFAVIRAARSGPALQMLPHAACGFCAWLPPFSIVQSFFKKVKFKYQARMHPSYFAGLMFVLACSD